MYIIRRTIFETIDVLISKRYINERGCWIWLGMIKDGYGAIKHGGKDYLVHRLIAYICLNFDLNSNLKVLHKCDTPRCFNPVHLFTGTDKDNCDDRDKKGRNGHTNKTHCPYGHPYDEVNTYWHPRGQRMCRGCKRKEARERYRKLKGIISI